MHNHVGAIGWESDIWTDHIHSLRVKWMVNRTGHVEIDQHWPARSFAYTRHIIYCLYFGFVKQLNIESQVSQRLSSTQLKQLLLATTSRKEIGARSFLSYFLSLLLTWQQNAHHITHWIINKNWFVSHSTTLSRFLDRKQKDPLFWQIVSWATWSSDDNLVTYC